MLQFWNERGVIQLQRRNTENIPTSDTGHIYSSVTCTLSLDKFFGRYQHLVHKYSVTCVEMKEDVPLVVEMKEDVPRVVEMKEDVPLVVEMKEDVPLVVRTSRAFPHS